MAGAFEIVMEHRRELVDKIIGMMKQGQFFNNPEKWNRDALRPQNPLSLVKYRGGNRLRLMQTVIEKGYTDPRWATLRQYKEKGYYPRRGEHGILCEKWIFTKEKTIKNEQGENEKVIEELERPQVSYFKVFNAQQIEDFPKYQPQEFPENALTGLIKDFISASECPIQELAQERAFYSPSADRIVLPLREHFKDEISFAKTVIHEMGHSTGHPSRLNRSMSGFFGSPEYAREELRAEIGALFIEADLGIQLNGEHYEDHSDYLKSWIYALEQDYNELFRACADAEKIAERLIGNYTRKFDQTLGIQMDEIVDTKEKVLARESEVAKKPFRR